MASPEYGPAAPQAALAALLAGNERFVSGALIRPHQDAGYRATLATQQRPFGVVFSCSDSRVAAEMIFDRGLGDLFVVRTAGHVLAAEVLASIEYGVSVLGAPLVVVLGHESCGAVQAALAARVEPVAPGLAPIVDGVTPSILAAQARDIIEPDQIAQVHVRRTVDAILRDSATTAAAVAAGTCAVVGMSYGLTDGRASLITAGPGSDGRLAAAVAGGAEA